MNDENKQLLNMIDNINDYVVESEMNVVNAMYENYEKINIMMEYVDDETISCVMEGIDVSKIKENLKTVGSKIAGLIKRAWGIIIGFFKTIVSSISLIINNLSGNKNQGKQTPDQILDEMGVKQSEHVESDGDKTFGAGKHQINIPFIKTKINVSSPQSKKDEVIEALCSDMMVKINKNNEMEIMLDGDPFDIKNKYQSPNKPDSLKTYGRAYVRSILVYLNEQGTVAPFDRIVTLMERSTELHDQFQNNSISKEEYTDSLNKLKKELIDPYVHSDLIYVELTNILSKKDHNKEYISFTTNDLNKVREALNSYLKKLDNSLPVEFMQEMDKDEIWCEVIGRDVLKRIEFFGNVLVFVQGFLNSMDACVKNAWIPNGKYANTIDDIETLGNFVDKMIDNNLSGKDIYRAAFMVASTKIKGGRKFDPHWGVSRGAFIPKHGEQIYKIALGPSGRACNANEYKISQILEKEDGCRYIAKCEASYGNHALNVMERIYDIGKLGAATNIMEDNISQALQKHVNIEVYDLGVGNMGKRKNGEYVAIDYGAAIPVVSLSKYKI